MIRDAKYKSTFIFIKSLGKISLKGSNMLAIDLLDSNDFVVFVKNGRNG